MEATVNRPGSKGTDFLGAKLGVQLKRELLPIDEYAEREGVSQGIVEECGKLGIVQIRKYRGKKFVVDVPLSPYRDSPQAGEAKGEGVQSVEKILRSLKPIEPVVKVTADEIAGIKEAAKKKLVNTSLQQLRQSSKEGRCVVGSPTAKDKLVLHPPGRTTKDESVLRPPRRTTKNESVLRSTTKDKCEERAKPGRRSGRRILEVTSKTRSASDGIEPAGKSPEPVRTPELEGAGIGDTLSRTDEAFKKLEESYEITDKLPIPIDELLELEESSEVIATPQEEEQSEFSAFWAGIRENWQVAKVCLFLFLIGLVFANFWFYMEQKAQLIRLESAYTRAQRVYGDLARTGRRAEVLREELSGSKAEVERVRSELDQARTEAESVRSELRRMEERSSTAVDQLNAQIRSFLAD